MYLEKLKQLRIWNRGTIRLIVYTVQFCIVNWTVGLRASQFHFNLPVDLYTCSYTDQFMISTQLYFVIRYVVLRRNISALPGKRENGSYMEARQQRHEFLIIFYFFVLPCNAHDLCLYLQFADSWESLLHRYRHRSLRPQILFFDCVRYSSIR